MSDLDPLSNRLNELSQSASVGDVDPLDDIRRGRRALRRRRARGAAGIATTLVVVCVVSATVHFPGNPVGDPGSSSPGGPDSPTVDVASSAISALCLEQASRLREFNQAPGSRPTAPVREAEPRRPPWKNPVIAPHLASYRQAALAILDPSGTHIDADVTNVQFSCNPSNDRLTTLGTKLGWTSSGALGTVQLEVVSPDHDQKPQIVLNHDHWTATEKNLPPGVTKARVTEYPDGRAVYVERQDGLTVAVDANGTWGNNVAPGSPSAGDLPTIDKLLKLTASKSLTLPED